MIHHTCVIGRTTSGGCRFCADRSEAKIEPVRVRRVHDIQGMSALHRPERSVERTKKELWDDSSSHNSFFIRRV